MSHFSKPWWGQILSISLKRSHASYRDSPSFWLNRVIWSLSLAVLEGRKNRERNDRLIWCHEVMEPTSREWNQALALSLKEKGKRWSLMASWFSFKVPLSLRKVEICKFGSSVGDPENWFCCTKLSSASLISKLSSSTVGYTIIACGSSIEGVAYSLRVRSAIVVLFRAFLLLLCINLSIWGTNSPRLLDLCIKEQEPKKLTVTIERKEKRKEKNNIK